MKLEQITNNQKLEFMKEEHKYYNDGIEMLSATTLLKEHGLAPNFKDVPGNVLQDAAYKGTIIHKLLEEMLKTKSIPQGGHLSEYGDSIWEFQPWKRYIATISEYRMASTYLGVAGTADFIGETPTGNLDMYDLKSGNADYMDFWYAAWQLAIYARLFKEQTGEVITGLGVWYFEKDDKDLPVMKEKDLTGWVDEKNLDQLFEAHKTGTVFKGNKIASMVPAHRSALIAFEEWTQQIAEETKKFNERKDRYDAMKLEVASIMEAYSLRNITILGDVKLTYVKGYKREGLNTEKLKREEPKIYEEYKTVTKVRPSVRGYINRVKELPRANNTK
jgi:hypothetical protein